MNILLGISFAFLCMISWATSDLVTKVSLDRESKWKVLVVGQFIGGAIVFLVALFFVDLRILLSEGVLYLLLLGFINFVGMYTFYKSMQAKGIALTVPIVASWAFITVSLGAIFYEDVVTALQWIAIALITIGVFSITFKKTKHIHFDKSFFYALASMFCWGIFFFLLKIPNEIFGALVVTFSIKLLTSFFSVPMLIKRKVSIIKTKPKAMFSLFLIGTLDAGGLLFFNAALSQTSLSIVSAISAAVPVVSVMLGLLVLKEKLTKMQAIGVGIAAVGLILVSI